jgi:MFS family permease
MIGDVHVPRPAQRSPFAALLVANAISLIGNQLTIVAIPWFVLQSTGSAIRAGQVGAVGAVAAVGAALVGGGIVDRLGARRTSIATDLMSGAVVALIPLLYHTAGLAFWQLLSLVFLRALLNTPGGAARQTLLPEVIARAELRLERGNAAYQGVQNSAQLLGPALAGGLIVILGTSNVLWLDAATFFASATITTGFIPYTVPACAHAEDAERASLLAELGEGLRFLRRDPIIRAVTATSAIGNFLATALFAVILPVYARLRFGDAVALGLLLAGWGGGALLGTLIYGALGPRLPRHTLLVSGTALAGLPLCTLALWPGMPSLGGVAVLALMGVCLGALNPLGFTLLQERTPPALRGRVFGAVFALGGIAAPLALLFAGYAVERFGTAAALFGEGAGFLALAIWLARSHAFRRTEP